MARLLVITVPAGDGLYEVILGDCVLPGFSLGLYAAAEEADEQCRRMADHYNLAGYPFDTPWKRRAEFVLIQGGAAPGNSADEKDK